MAPIVHCVRHAQGFHNLGAEFHQLRDPKLTPLGEEQCATLKSKHFPDQSKISLVTASPMTRTINTAFATFEPALSNGKCKNQILALPDAQETSDFPCDTGSDIPELTQKCESNGWPVNLALLNEGWNIKTLGNRYSPASHALKARARDTRKQIRVLARELIAAGDKDPQIVLVTHGGYLHYFTDDWEAADKYNGTGWHNTETRAYNFELGVDDDSEADAFLVETAESRQKRGKEHPMYGKDKQDGLFRKTMQGWEDQGLQNPSKIGSALSDVYVEGQEPAAKNAHIEKITGIVRVVA